MDLKLGMTHFICKKSKSHTISILPNRGNLRPKFGQRFGTRSVMTAKYSALVECYNLTFGPSLASTVLMNIDPAEAGQFPMEYLEKVKAVHSVGGYGSQG